ncbi:MAG: SHOCT domain-containing protein [Gammaproteobacteria bacterium]
MGGGGFGFGHGVFGPLFSLVVVVAIVVMLRGVWRGRSGRGGDIGAGRTPREILEERYARGEIDEQEFERRRRDLEG